jgi:hypothetical protein
MTADEVVLSRADWERIVAALSAPRSEAEQAEDEHDIAAVEAARADDLRFAAPIRAERGSELETTIPIDVVKAELDGAHPIRACATIGAGRKAFWRQIPASVAT